MNALTVVIRRYSIPQLTLRPIVLCASLLYGLHVLGASLVVDPKGILTGASDVLVNGSLYNVQFVDGTCAAAYGVCDSAHFAFTTESSALAASKALIDQVLLDVPGVGTLTPTRR